MKSFAEISVELKEAKFKLPRGHKELKRDVVKIGGKEIVITYTEYRGKVHVYVNGQDFGGATYKDMKTAEKEMKSMKSVIKQMSEEENIDIEEIFNEVNIRV